MKKITHLIFSFNTGGAETMLVDIVNEQVLTNEVNIIIINNVFNESLLQKIDNRVKLYFMNRKERGVVPFPILKLNILLLLQRFDVLHCHNHNIVPLIFPSFRKKTVLTIHDVGKEINYLRCYNKVFAISKVVKDDIYKRSNIKAVLVYNGINTERVLMKEGYTKGNVFKTIIISRLVHQKKGQHLVIEALRLLKEKGIKNIKLDLIGTGASAQFLKDLVLKYGLGDQVSFLGFKDRDYIYTFLKDYNLLIQPSLYEGFGLTVVEGMAAKVPVLVSDTDGPIEIIEHGKYGFYFINNNIHSLSKSLMNIIENYNSIESHEKIDLAYSHVCNVFSIKRTAKLYIENYNC